MCPVTLVMVRAKLKIDWDLSIQPPGNSGDPVGHFVGRARERALIANELLRSSQRSIFISGHRGVGKTSLIYRALFDVREQAGAKRFLRVLLNAAQLEAEAEQHEGIEPRQILVNLIRRLYTAVEAQETTADIKGKTETLYSKAVAAEFSERQDVGRTLLREVTSERTAEFTIKAAVPHIPVWLIGWVTGVLLALSDPINGGHLNDLIAVVVAGPLPLAVSGLLEYRRTESMKEIDRRRAQSLYLFDASIGNLEFDLEQIHRLLTEAGFTTLYVIDELDKLEADRVVEVLRFFKTLFTLSSAVFVFIGGEELAARFRDDGEAGMTYRPMHYTYFTSTYFLPRPRADDLYAFLEEITTGVEGDSDGDPLWPHLKRTVVFDAKGDFFDLIQCVRDRIADFEPDGEPVMILDELSAEEKTRARMQWLIEILFSQKYETFVPSRWRENEEVLRALYEVASSIAKSPPGYAFTDPADNSLPAAAVRDFGTLLNRIGAITVTETGTAEIEGESRHINTYSYAGIVESSPPEQLSFLSEVENQFIDAMEALADDLRRFLNLQRALRGDRPRRLLSVEDAWADGEGLGNWGVSVLGAVTDAMRIYSGLTRSRPPEVFARDTVEQVTQQVQGARDLIPANDVTLISGMVRETLGWVVGQAASDGALFSEEELAELRGALMQPDTSVVFQPDYSRQLAVMRSPDLGLIHKIRGGLTSRVGSHRLLVLTGDRESYRRRSKAIRAVDITKGDDALNVAAMTWLREWSETQ
jgi:hypothetical protein